MFAVIIQSETVMGPRQTAIVPMLDQSVRVFSRVGQSRGVAGAWREETPPLSGRVIGKPVAIGITPSDYAILQYPVTPTVLLQKLVRTVKDVTTVSSDYFNTVFDDVKEIASTNPSGLVSFTKAMATAMSPSIQVVQPVQVAQPIRVPDVVTAYFPQEEIALPSQEYLEEQVLTAPPIQVESEPPMEFSSTVAPTRSETEAVLTVPDVEPYFPRTFDGIKEEKIYDVARAAKWNVLLTGDAGTGKTSSARNYAAVNGLPFVTIECTQQIDQSITQGRFVPTGVGNSTKWKYSQLATAIQRPSVILINEMTRMTPKAASLFLRLLQERELLIEPLNEVIKVHPDVLFVADQNTGLGYTGTSKQDAALVDRFNVKLEFHYDIEIEKNFINSSTLLQFAQNIREASELNDEFSVPMSSRILQNFQAQATNLNFEFAVNSMLSNYPKLDGERDAIKMRFDAEADQIASEIGVSLGKYSTR